MKSIDTNVVARFVLADNPEQHLIASALIASGAFVPLTVLLESFWLLQSRGGLSRAQITQVVLNLIDLPSVTVQDEQQVRWAVQRYAAGADAADILHLIVSGAADCFATFDQRIARDVGNDPPIAIETLR